MGDFAKTSDPEGVSHAHSIRVNNPAAKTGGLIIERIPVAVLGSSGLVAQRLQQRLVNHPWFELVAVAGSEGRVGQPLSSIAWRLDDGKPDLPPITVEPLDDRRRVAHLVRAGVKVAFSALPADVAKRVEPLWASCGIAVFSNASAFRRVAGVPLVVPEVNPESMLMMGHLDRPMACATNCTLLPLLLPLTALCEAFGLTSWSMRSEQALSGGGYGLIDRVASSGVWPAEIEGEAEKTEAEFRHLLDWNGEAELTCERVNRQDGHHVFVEAVLGQSVDDHAVVEAIRTWSERATPKHLPSAPTRCVMTVDKVDPTVHLLANGHDFPSSSDPTVDLTSGMAVVVGAIETNGNTVRFEGFSHNTLRGAAGGTVYLAELALDLGLLGPTQAQG